MTEAELALERAKKLAFLMTERFSMNPICWLSTLRRYGVTVMHKARVGHNALHRH